MDDDSREVVQFFFSSFVSDTISDQRQSDNANRCCQQWYQRVFLQKMFSFGANEIKQIKDKIVVNNQKSVEAYYEETVTTFISQYLNK